MLLYWSPSRDTFVSIRIYLAFEKKFVSKFGEGRNIFIEEKKNGTLAVMVSSIVTAVTQKCCTPLSPSESTWHLRRSMCGGNSRRPTWKRNFQKKSPRSGLLGLQKKAATAFSCLRLSTTEKFTTPHHRHWSPYLTLCSPYFPFFSCHS